ncbi:MAG TPA: flagellar basal-body rod protein FlgF [Chloroflexota bacterium]|nr:flagellar basal-body rod protein FlgF [Chloroflexota bacterium]
MIRGLYTAASSMLAHMRREEVITNNLANANTIGFRGDDAEMKAFPLEFLNRLFDTNRDANGNVLPSSEIGGLNTGLMIDQVTTSYREGPIRETNNGLDMALRDTAGPTSPPAFFAVQTPTGTQFTRDGSFNRNANGELVTNQGYRVLGQGGAPIVLPASQDSEVKVQPDGTILVNSQQVGKLQIVTFQNPEALDKPGNTLFAQNARSGQPTPANPTDYAVQDHALEMSNVDPVRSMAEMLDTMRAYEMNQKMVQTQDELLGKAVNDIAKS